MIGYLLDTTTLVDLLNGRPEVLARFIQLPADAYACASVISQGELLVGAYRRRGSHQPDPRSIEELDHIARLLTDLAGTYPVTQETAAYYGRMQGQLVRQGKRKLTINDGWIAATALEQGLTLVTSDERLKGLGEILRIEDWRV